MADRFSHPSTTMSAPLTPTAQVPVYQALAYAGWVGAVMVGNQLTSLDGLACIFNLEDVSIGTADVD